MIDGTGHIAQRQLAKCHYPRFHQSLRSHCPLMPSSFIPGRTVFYRVLPVRLRGSPGNVGLLHRSLLGYGPSSNTAFLYAHPRPSPHSCLCLSPESRALPLCPSLWELRPVPGQEATGAAGALGPRAQRGGRSHSWPRLDVDTAGLPEGPVRIREVSSPCSPCRSANRVKLPLLTWAASSVLWVRRARTAALAVVKEDAQSPSTRCPVSGG